MKLRKSIYFICLIILVALFTGGHLQAQKVLIYTRNYTPDGKGYVHKNIKASIEALENICNAEGLKTIASDDPKLFTKENLKSFDAIIFSNSNNEAFENDEQREAFKAYIQNGGGFVGIHSSSGSERNWPWFQAMQGGKFRRHPPFQEFTIQVIDPTHPSTKHLGKTWQWEDECYYLDHLNPDIHILLAADMTTIKDKHKEEYPGRIFGDYFPICWCHSFDGGRQWYTALGHEPNHYKDKNMIEHLKGGILWVLKK